MEEWDVVIADCKKLIVRNIIEFVESNVTGRMRV
jgi:hypothetical protein